MQRILVPLDGSAEAETALALAEQLAAAQQAQLVLLRAVEPFTWADTEGGPVLDTYPSLLEQAMNDAEASLAERARDLESRGRRTEHAVLMGQPAATILDYETDHHPDLVVMATHGRSGLARFAMGSVTDRVVREGGAPVLVIRRSSSPTEQLQHALLLLDGSGLAEQALPLVEMLAGKPLKRVTLFRAVANPEDRGPATTYLEGVAPRLAKAGLETRVVVDTGEPAHVVDRAAHEADFVVLCTHGRSGFDRLRHGSVAEHVVRAVDKPVLLVRARS